VLDLDSFFSSDGPLQKIIPGYHPRAAQVEMAEAVAAAIDSGKHFIAEAGTGTGKTFAYLVPAILSGKKVLVSTGTKNLQDQLFYKDLPVIRKALAIPFNAALLKGRSNYLCLYRLKNAMQSNYGHQRDDASALATISSWAKRTQVGDIAEVSAVPEAAPIWSQATSTQDNCLGQDCPDYSECLLVKARKKAQEAEILVVNHHLLCADWSIREIGFGELLPNVEVVIIDEAHQLANTASNFLGSAVGAKQFNDLARDTLVEYFSDAVDMPDLRQACENLEHELQELRLVFGVDIKKGDWREIEHNPKIMAGISKFQAQLQKLIDQLELASVRSKGLESCFKRGQDLESSLQTILQDNSGKWIRWYETYKKTFTFNRTPLDIANEFQTFMQHNHATWIFTSATLSVAGKFEHFSNSLGIKNAQCQSWESPFDYPGQSLFYHPRNLPQPSTANFIHDVVEMVLPVLAASKGRAFFLFTSHRALKEAAMLLQEKTDFLLLVQGSRPKSLLLEEFKRHGNAILLGTSSFWEGVDVRGKALSCVIIDKLPFASPGDPVLKARLSALQKQGRNAFAEQQLPAAVINLKQGVGRLIRDVTDRGVLMLCDPRLLKRAYGQLFLDSVPAMRRTRDIKEVQAFFAEEENEVISR
jgi:ATP-dependent DNA helicase DinG